MPSKRYRSASPPPAKRQKPAASSYKPALASSSAPARRKKSKPNPFTTGTPRPKQHTVNTIKTRIRDLTRQLARAETEGARDFPADVKIGKERELATLRHELAGEQKEVRRSEMIGRYHMVRFFERQKATRVLKKANKAAAAAEETGEDVEASREQLKRAEVELAYTMYYPFMRPYVSLYPSKKKVEKDRDALEDMMEVDSDAKDEGLKGDKEIWALIEKAVGEGKASLERLRDSEDANPEGVQEVVNPAEGRPKRGKFNPSTGRTRETGNIKNEKKDVEDMDDESDGGFFE